MGQWTFLEEASFPDSFIGVTQKRRCRHSIPETGEEGNAPAQCRACFAMSRLLEETLVNVQTLMIGKTIQGLEVVLSTKVLLVLFEGLTLLRALNYLSHRLDLVDLTSKAPQFKAALTRWTYLTS